MSSDSKRIAIAANGADMVLDVLGGLKNSEPTIACINALRPRGTAVFMGGVQADIPIPYSKIMLEELTIRGAFMYPRHVLGEIYKMIAAGVLDLAPLQVYAFPLDKVNEAVVKAAQSKGFDYYVIVPHS